MLEIAESNSETSNNSIKLVIATLVISIAKLIAIALAILIIAALLKLATLAILITATRFKCNAYKAIFTQVSGKALQ